MKPARAAALRYLRSEGLEGIAEMLGLIEPTPNPKPVRQPRRACKRPSLRPLNDRPLTAASQYLSDPAERIATVAALAPELVRRTRRTEDAA